MIPSFLVALVALVAGVLSAPLHAATVTVFAAASLTDTLQQTATDYERRSGDRIVFNFAASGTLARQIESGAPADLFLSADEARADALQEQGLLVPETRVSRLGNALVLVVPPESTAVRAPADLTNAAVTRVALGQVRSVPAGTYAKAYLEARELWAAVQPKIVPCENVRAVLAAVASGNVDAGIVYRTDAAISRKVKVAFEVPVADGPKISYPFALVSAAPQPDAAKRFLAHLCSPAADDVLRAAGFVVLARKSHTQEGARISGRGQNRALIEGNEASTVSSLFGAADTLSDSVAVALWGFSASRGAVLLASPHTVPLEVAPDGDSPRSHEICGLAPGRPP